MIVKNKTFFFLIVGILLFGLSFILLEFDLVEAIDRYDEAIRHFFSFSSFRIFFLMITSMMTMFGILGILGITFYLLRKKQAEKDMYLFIISVLACLSITNLIKILVQRVRPSNMLLNISGYSFPSCHSSVSMVVYGYLIFLIRKYYTGKHTNLYIGICIFLILVTGLSRIYFNVHYITDVIAGYGIGIIVLCGSHFLIQKLTNPKK